MSEADYLRALAFDFEDELTCLEADLLVAERDNDEVAISEIEGEIESAMHQIALVNEDLVEWGRTNG